jgi:hypothetical protein
LERAADGGSLGSAPGRDPAASPERAHWSSGSIPLVCFSTADTMEELLLLGQLIFGTPVGYTSQLFRSERAVEILDSS